MDMSQYRGLFISEAREHLRVMNEAIVALEQDPADRERIDDLFRQAHSIKGMAASMEFGAVAGLAHRMEDLMDHVRKGEFSFCRGAADLLLEGADILDSMVNDVEQGGEGALPTGDLPERLAVFRGETAAVTEAVEEPEEEPLLEADEAVSPSAPPQRKAETLQGSTVRVRTDLLDQLITITGELVTTRHRFADIAGELSSPRFGEAFADLSRLLRELHDRVLQVRMMPVSGVMDRFPRLVRDLARKSGKEIVLDVEGKEIELDRGILEELGDPLIHILRNAVDHGIEAPEERRRTGKPGAGRISILVRQEKDQVVIAVSDDGRGMNAAVIAAAAVRKGILSADEAARLTPREALLLTCAPGFSTADRVTDLSGRGVGMDAVKTCVQSLGGLLSVESDTGAGTSIVLKLPRSVAIINVLLVRCGGVTVGVPISRVLHVLDVPGEKVLSRGDRLVAVTGDEEIPLHFLREIFRLPAAPPRPLLPVLVVDLQGGKAGIVVDGIAGQQEVFVKPVGRPLESIRGISGGAVLGDGRGIFIIDTGELL
jgi:two-component system, chemotaxis family, sensor kinase CheA